MIEIQIIGNLGADAENKKFNGNDFTVFSLASSERYKDKDGNLTTSTTWISCFLLNGKNILPYLRKGTTVFVRGSLSVKVNKVKGTEYVNLNCNVSKIRLVSSQPKNDAPGNSSSTRQAPDLPPMMMQPEDIDPPF